MIATPATATIASAGRSGKMIRGCLFVLEKVSSSKHVQFLTLSHYSSARLRKIHKMRQHPMSEMSRSQGPDIRPEGQQSQRKPGELPLIGNLGICCKRAFIMIYT